MNSNLPLVTIGLPVYNGWPHLETAVKSLLAQDYPHVELLICDNASTDATGDLCRRLIEGHPRAHYQRNAENVGPYRNFLGLVERARGDYFMWAAHDDKWDPRYVSALVERLEANREAVLATPAVIHIRPDGTLCNEPPDRPSPDKSPVENLRVLFDDHAAGWLYGLYRTEWARQHAPEWTLYPVWGFDVLWLADVCLSNQVTGNQDAILYKRLRRSGFAPKTSVQAVAFWAYMFWYFTRIVVRRTQGRERVQVLLMSWRYVYRLCIRRPGALRTAWRVVRMLSLAALASLPAAAAQLWRWAKQAAKVPSGA